MMLLSDFFERFYRPRRLPNGRPATLKHHRTYIRLFSDWLRRPALTRDLTNDLVAGFVAHYAVGRSPWSAATAHNSLMALWRYSRMRGACNESPDLLAPRLPDVNPEAWSPSDFSRLTAAALLWSPGRIIRTAYPVPPSLWWSAFLRVGYDTGFRRAALLALRFADLSRWSATARASASKTWRDETRALAPDTLAAVDAIREPERITVFAFFGCEATYYRHFSTLLRLAGLPGGPKNKTQRIRRTSATLVASVAGLTAAQEHLGHESLRTTRRHYLDASQVSRPNMAIAIPRPDATITLRIVE